MAVLHVRQQKFFPELLDQVVDFLPSSAGVVLDEVLVQELVKVDAEHRGAQQTVEVLGVHRFLVGKGFLGLGLHFSTE